MTADHQGYKGCKVILHDAQTGKKLAETVVRDYDKNTLTIQVDEKHFEQYPCERVLLLILCGTCMYEYKGTVRRSGSFGMREIALFQGKEKEERTTRRYAADAPARVEKVVLVKRLVPLRRPFDAVVRNISTEGVLIQGPLGALNVDTTFQLKLVISGSDTLLNTTVVRINRLDDNNAEYGCKFNFLYPPEGA